MNVKREQVARLVNQTNRQSTSKRRESFITQTSDDNRLKRRGNVSFLVDSNTHLESKPDVTVDEDLIDKHEHHIPGHELVGGAVEDAERAVLFGTNMTVKDYPSGLFPRPLVHEHGPYDVSLSSKLLGLPGNLSLTESTTNKYFGQNARDNFFDRYQYIANQRNKSENLDDCLFDKTIVTDNNSTMPFGPVRVENRIEASLRCTPHSSTVRSVVQQSQELLHYAHATKTKSNNDSTAPLSTVSNDISINNNNNNSSTYIANEHYMLQHSKTRCGDVNNSSSNNNIIDGAYSDDEEDDMYNKYIAFCTDSTSNKPTFLMRRKMKQILNKVKDLAGKNTKQAAVTDSKSDNNISTSRTVDSNVLDSTAPAASGVVKVNNADYVNSVLNRPSMVEKLDKKQSNEDDMMNNNHDEDHYSSANRRKLQWPKLELVTIPVSESNSGSNARPNSSYHNSSNNRYRSSKHHNNSSAKLKEKRTYVLVRPSTGKAIPLPSNNAAADSDEENDHNNMLVTGGCLDKSIASANNMFADVAKDEDSYACSSVMLDSVNYQSNILTNMNSLNINDSSADNNTNTLLSPRSKYIAGCMSAGIDCPQRMLYHIFICCSRFHQVFSLEHLWFCVEI